MHDHNIFRKILYQAVLQKIPFPFVFFFAMITLTIGPRKHLLCMISFIFGMIQSSNYAQILTAKLIVIVIVRTSGLVLCMKGSKYALHANEAGP